MAIPRMPASANLRAVAAPMPREAPVINATFPARLIIQITTERTHRPSITDGACGGKVSLDEHGVSRFFARKKVREDDGEHRESRREDKYVAETIRRNKMRKHLRRQRSDTPRRPTPGHSRLRRYVASVR